MTARPPWSDVAAGDPPELGDLVVVLLASTLAGLRDRLYEDGFDDAAELVSDLVKLADAHLARGGLGPWGGRRAGGCREPREA